MSFIRVGLMLNIQHHESDELLQLYGVRRLVLSKLGLAGRSHRITEYFCGAEACLTDIALCTRRYSPAMVVFQTTFGGSRNGCNSILR